MEMEKQEWNNRSRCGKYNPKCSHWNKSMTAMGDSGFSIIQDLRSLTELVQSYEQLKCIKEPSNPNTSDG